MACTGAMPVAAFATTRTRAPTSKNCPREKEGAEGPPGRGWRGEAWAAQGPQAAQGVEQGKPEGGFFACATLSVAAANSTAARFTAFRLVSAACKESISAFFSALANLYAAAATSAVASFSNLLLASAALKSSCPAAVEVPGK